MMESKISHGPVQPTAEALLQLQSSAHSLHELQKAGYILSQLPAAEIERKKRCEQCCKERRNRPQAKLRLPLAPVVGVAASDTSQALSLQNDLVAATGSNTFKYVHLSNTSQQQAVDSAESGKRGAGPETGQPDETPLVCKFHSGRVVNRTWTCCNKPSLSKPCSGREQHTARQYKADELEKNWRFYETPTGSLPSHVAAVVLDCEMGTASSGESELIRISVVDYFTGAVLLDKLVYPNVRMAHYNTRFSGVTRHAMEEARRRHNCLIGRDAARQALYKFVGPNTVVVGHATHGDLSCLRWIHRLVVDTLLIETERRQIQLAFSKALDDKRPADIQEGAAHADVSAEVEGNKSDMLQKEGGLSLKALALKRLDRVIQIKGRGHDSLEDALATRDLLHWYMANPLNLDT
ncbi:hypothetical protein C2857_002857 [Epichloe festucae Fl1]|uniref:Exonuclease domain-containing protein n=1 Tax=Epichloe festucae (strain Fl1) TaxID=877507 RepID=A0A7S9KKL7_EPIFF|nr:hypothetical protein C2857_002857 [Epichloe festucae Fl1]